MSLSQYDKNRLAEFYGTALKIHGPESPKALRWLNASNQKVRFEILSRAGDLNGSSVLDLGCGVGDMYPFLLKNFKQVDYLGIDILPEMVKQARKKYQGGRFWTMDIFNIDEKFDYIFASGTFSFNVSSGKEYYYEIIKRMFTLSGKAAAFNMLDSSGTKSDKNYLTYSPAEVAEMLKKITPNYKIVMGYELGDFTVFLPKTS